MVNHVQVQRNKRNTLLYGHRRECCKGRIHWRKLKVLSIVTSHWLSLEASRWRSCYWAGRTLFLLQLGWEEYVGGAGAHLPVGSVVSYERHVVLEFSQPPHSIEMRVLFIKFSQDYNKTKRTGK